jgi:hypothetical protein
VRLTFAVVLLLATATNSGAQVSSEGFPVTVIAADGANVSVEFLNATANAIAHRWVTPSNQRATFTQWRRVRARTLPEIPRWADDFTPAATHRASTVLVLRRRGRPTISAPSPASGDAFFDGSLASVVRDPMPASPAFPDIPASVSADTLALRVSFGIEPAEPGHGVIRFAAVQEPAALVPGSMNIDYRERRTVAPGERLQSSVAVLEGFNIIVKYDILVDGSVDPRSIQVLESNDRDLQRAIELALQRARFVPARTNRISVRTTVVQLFGG